MEFSVDGALERALEVAMIMGIVVGIRLQRLIASMGYHKSL